MKDLRRETLPGAKVVAGPLTSPPPMTTRTTPDVRARALDSATRIFAAIIAANGPVDRTTEARITHDLHRVTDTYAHYITAGEWPGGLSPQHLEDGWSRTDHLLANMQEQGAVEPSP